MIKNKIIRARDGFTILIFLFHSALVLSQQSISEIRMLLPGTAVTTTGIITSGPQWGSLRYMQDNEAGIALYSSTLGSTVPGDSIIVSGVISIYKGELQLFPVTSFEVKASGRSIEEIEVTNLKDISTSSFESRKIHISCLGISSCETLLEDGWYSVFDQEGNKARLKIWQDDSVIGFPITDGPVAVTGIWTKIEDQYQLICQSINDASEGMCHYIHPGFYTLSALSTPTLNWNNIPLANTIIKLRIDEDTIDIGLGLREGDIQLFVDFLRPHKIYETWLCQEGNSGKYFCSLPFYFSVPSSSLSPIEILFTRSVNSLYSDGSHPISTGPAAIETDIINRIDQVENTIEVAMYNTTREPIVQALNRAKQRGVSVRYIADDETSNTALQAPLFPVLYRAGDGIMHHKFIIGDVADTLKAWVWTGSTNFSSNQVSTDPNHAFIIHDKAFALNYQREFDEIWGELPDHSDGDAGEFKTDNTVHSFEIQNFLIESYYSPSDETNCHIIEALRSADHHVEIGLLLFTKEDLVDELIDLHQQGVEIRVIIEDEASSSLALSRLQQAGISTAIHDLSPLFHHKYAIVDEGYENSDPLVITGSHNWTWSADNINDENTLIVHNQSFANIFRQEFEARWEELEPTSTTTLTGGSEFIIHPNPASDFIDLTNPKNQKCEVTFIDIRGAIISKHQLVPLETFRLNLVSSVPDGIYLLHWKWKNDFAASRFTVQH